MNINYKEAQFEFFPNADGAPDETKRPHLMAARFNFSIENLVIFSIVSIMVVIFTFSIGVERGKRIALRDGAAPVADMRLPGASVDASAASNVTEKNADVTVKPVNKVPVVVSPVKVPASAIQPQDAIAKASGGYTVQVASYKTEKSAQKEALALQKKGLKAFILPKGQHIVLCVGNFQKKEDATVYGKKLKSNYQDYVVRRL